MADAPGARSDLADDFDEDDALQVRAVAVTHRGRVRANNQDAVAIGDWIGQSDMTHPIVIKLVATSDRPIAFVVADGLGGHPAGDVASRLAAQRIADRAAASGPDLLAAADDLTVDANLHLYQHMARARGCVGMGSTVAGLLAGGEHCAVFNAGDSRVYRWQDGYLCQITVDDSAFGSHGVAQCLGGASAFAPVAPHVTGERWLRGRRYLICSDGLTTPLPIEALEVALALPAESAVQALLDAVLAAGAPDNVTIVILERE